MKFKPQIISFLFALALLSFFLLVIKTVYQPNQNLFYSEEPVLKIEWNKGLPTPGSEKDYKPQGLTWAQNFLFFSNYWKNDRSRIYKLDPNDNFAIIGYFDMPKEADHTSGLAFDGKFLWAADYHSNYIYKIDPEASLKTHQTVLKGSFDTGLKGLSACTFAEIDGQIRLVYSDFRNTQKNYIIDQEQAVNDGRVNKASLIASFKNAGFSQGLTWTGKYLLDSHGKCFRDVIYCLDLEKAIKTGTYQKAIVKVVQAPDDMVEDLAFHDGTLWTSDESTFRFYSTGNLAKVFSDKTTLSPGIIKDADYKLLFLKQPLTEKDFGTLAGFWLVVLTVIIFLILVPILQKGKKHIGIYRPYEEKLLSLNRLDLDDLLDYHAQYKWGNYSGMALAMTTLCVVLIIQNQGDLSALQITIQNVIVGIMSIAVILLVFADLVHTNTQTPIIPLKTRFGLINLSVQMGTFGSILLVAAIIMFSGMLSFKVVLISCLIFNYVVCYSFLLRRIPKKDFFRYFGIFDHTLWKAGDTKENGENKIFRHDKEQIELSLKKSDEIFYKKMGRPRPVSVKIEEWIHDMIVNGFLEKDNRQELSNLIDSTIHLTSTRDEDKKQELIRKFVDRLKSIQEKDLVETDHLKSLLDQLTSYSTWTHADIERIKDQILSRDEQKD